MTMHTLRRHKLNSRRRFLGYSLVTSVNYALTRPPTVTQQNRNFRLLTLNLFFERSAILIFTGINRNGCISPVNLSVPLMLF